MKQSEMAGPASSKRVQLSIKDFFIDTGYHEHLLARNFRNIYHWRDRLLFTNPMIDCYLLQNSIHREDGHYTTRIGSQGITGKSNF